MNDIAKLQARIARAREHMRAVQRGNAVIAAVLAGASGIVTSIVEFPDPDIAHVYHGVFGRKTGEPTVYRLAFSEPLTWVGISHPWGKPADIVVPLEAIDANND